MEVKSKTGLVFRLVGEEPYRKKDGSMTKLRVWTSACKVCDETFTVSTPGNADKQEDSKAFSMLHCQKHRLTREQVTERWQKAIAESRQ